MFISTSLHVSSNYAPIIRRNYVPVRHWYFSLCRGVWRVLGPKRDEVTGEWRKLHNEELRDFYSLPNIVQVVKSRRMRWAGHVERMGEGRGVHRVLVRKPEGKRPLGRPKHRWEDNINTLATGYRDFRFSLRVDGRGVWFCYVLAFVVIQP